MPIRKYLLATVITTLVMFTLAGIWHEVVMAQVYDRHHEGGHDGTAIIFLAYLILAALMVYLFSQWQYRSDSLTKGLMFGGVIDLLWVFPHELAMAGAHREPLGYVSFKALWHLIEQGAGGLVIARLSVSPAHASAGSCQS